MCRCANYSSGTSYMCSVSFYRSPYPSADERRGPGGLPSAQSSLSLFPGSSCPLAFPGSRTAGVRCLLSSYLAPGLWPIPVMSGIFPNPTSTFPLSLRQVVVLVEYPCLDFSAAPPIFPSCVPDTPPPSAGTSPCNLVRRELRFRCLPTSRLAPPESIEDGQTYLRTLVDFSAIFYRLPCQSPVTIRAEGSLALLSRVDAAMGMGLAISAVSAWRAIGTVIY
ncbi:hypothetical protein C8Q79DRAFT_254892 [Trametes meyenii]|nr:hypothetical protein C8Q79DRAFT_254892 [Trametes meyenii]